VGIWATNCFEWVIVQFATAKNWRDSREHQSLISRLRIQIRTGAVAMPDFDYGPPVPRFRFCLHLFRDMPRSNDERTRGALVEVVTLRLCNTII
jgi:hypothetical protein